MSLLKFPLERHNSQTDGFYRNGKKICRLPCVMQERTERIMSDIRPFNDDSYLNNTTKLITTIQEDEENYWISYTKSSKSDDEDIFEGCSGLWDVKGLNGKPIILSERFERLHDTYYSGSDTT